MSMVRVGLKGFRRRRRLFPLAVVSRPGKKNILCVLCASVVNFYRPSSGRFVKRLKEKLNEVES
jgi:hypothetical protein